MKVRNNVTSLTSISLSILLGMALFFAVYSYVGANVQSAGLTPDDNFTSSNDELINQMGLLDDHLDNITASFAKIGEAENTAFAVWNGMKGIGLTLLLPITLVSIGVSSFEALIFGDNFLPPWVITLAGIAILAIILFTVLGALKGESRL